jgi:hypothetical protein
MKAASDFDEKNPIVRNQETTGADEDFYPKGAIAFFVSMLIGFGLIWAALYGLMLHRQFHL